LPFTDIHSHILPGFDDGAADDAEFLEMARVAVRGGTSRMAATPHYDLETPDLELAEVIAAVERQTGLLLENGIPLLLVPGVEVRINAGLYRAARDAGDLGRLSLGGTGKYILTDLPLIDMPSATDDILFQVQLRGLTPILAHPERNRYLSTRPDVIRRIAERGVAIQVNSGSLEGIYGKTARRSALELLKEGIVNIVASDAHAPDGRTTDLSGAARILRSKIGKEAMRILLEENPERALRGEELLRTSGEAPRPAGNARMFRRGKRL
jgi:protein-tyrosine phosphatase